MSNAGVHEQRVAGVALERRPPLDLLRPRRRRSPCRRGTGSSGRSPSRGRPGGCEPWASASSRSPVASIGSLGRPIVRANTLVDPPGSAASAQCRCRPARWPPRSACRRRRARRPPRCPSAAAPWARRVAWPRRLVSARVTSWSADSAFWITTRPRAVTDDADELTSSSTFTAAVNLRRGPVWPRRPGRRATDAAMNVVVCVKQIPDPAEPGRAGSRTNTLKRDGKLILDESDSYGVEMALQLVDTAGGGEVTLVSMAPNSEVERPAHRPRHGRGQGHPRQRRRPRGRRRPRHRQGAGRRHQAGRGRRPGPHRHRVDRRLHGHRARADRRPPRPAVDHLRQARSRSTAAPSRSSARPRPATTRSSARCPPWCR